MAVRRERGGERHRNALFNPQKDSSLTGLSTHLTLSTTHTHQNTERETFSLRLFICALIAHKH